MNFIPQVVVEVPPFPDRADAVWSDIERQKFIDYIACHPTEGNEIVGTGGIRKIRWGYAGKGKRGGVRVIYFYYNETAPIFIIDCLSEKQARGSK